MLFKATMLSSNHNSTETKLLHKMQTEERGSVLYLCPKIYSWKQLSQQQNKSLCLNRWICCSNADGTNCQILTRNDHNGKYLQFKVSTLSSSLNFPHVPTIENRQFGMHEIHFAPRHFFSLSADKNHKQCTKTTENTTSPVCLSWSMQGCPSFGE